MEVRVDVLRPMGRRAASNDDVVPKSKNKAHQSLSRRTNTALAKSSGPSPANLTSYILSPFLLTSFFLRFRSFSLLAFVI